MEKSLKRYVVTCKFIPPDEPGMCFDGQRGLYGDSPDDVMGKAKEELLSIAINVAKKTHIGKTEEEYRALAQDIYRDNIRIVSVQEAEESSI